MKGKRDTPKPKREKHSQAWMTRLIKRPYIRREIEMRPSSRSCRRRSTAAGSATSRGDRRFRELSESWCLARRALEGERQPEREPERCVQ